MRLIDADALPVHKAYCVDEAGFGATFYVVDKEDIDKALTIDAVPVVRCKDCQHSFEDDFDGSWWCCRDIEREVVADHFCSYGERRIGQC